MPAVKDVTARTYLRTLGKFIGYVTGDNPYRESMMLWNNDVPERKFIFNEDWERLKEHSDSAEMLIISLGGGMGLRRAEIANIRLSDIIGTKLVIRGKGHGVKGKQVTKNIPDSVRDAIRAYLPYRQAVIDLYGNHSQGNLLVRIRKHPGEPMTPDCVYNAVSSLAKRAGVNCTTHSLRRLYATTLYDAGTELNVIRKMMRHESLDTTLNCYINVDPRKISNAEGELEDRLLDKTVLK
ncbi:MAG: site-specific integrase [Candidatus Methanomethylophilaceae archaeon]|nr:site-specific integrase [Candidatus Methanomethylophilaceae archaeon]